MLLRALLIKFLTYFAASADWLAILRTCSATTPNTLLCSAIRATSPEALILKYHFMHIWVENSIVWRDVKLSITKPACFKKFLVSVKSEALAIGF